MSIGTRFVTGAKFVNKGFSFLSHNKGLLLYPLIAILAILGVGILYFHPIVKAVVAAGNPANVNVLLVSNPNLFSPSLLVIVFLFLALLVGTTAFAMLINRIAFLINPQSTKQHTIRSLLTTHWLNFVLYFILMAGVSYFSRLFVTTSLGGLVHFIIMALQIFMVFTLHYILLKNMSTFNAIRASIQFVWERLAYVIGAYVWFMLITVALALVPFVATIPFGAFAAIIAALVAIIGIFSSMTAAIIGMTMIFLSAYNELPAIYDATRPRA